MTILHLSAVNNWGGGGNQIENLCFELSQSNPEIRSIIVVAEKGQFHERLKKKNLEFDTVPLSFNLDPRAIYKIIKLCKNEKVDLIHIHGSKSISLAVIADHFANLPPFIFSKKISFPVKKRKQTLYKYNYSKIKKIFCVSNQTKNIMAKAIMDKEKLITIYHGTRIDNKSSVTPFLLRKKFPILPHQKIVGNIANHHEAKNLESFVDVANYLVNIRKQNQFHFVQIGSFTERTSVLKEKMKELNLEKHITFVGFINNASNFIPQFDVTLITSTNEGIPQVIYESFYHKIPVVSTNVAGIPEVVKNNETGLLADPNDNKALANHISSLMSDTALQKKITEVSCQKLHSNFTTKLMAEKMLAEYKEILNGRS